MSYETNPYFHPEALGLIPIAEIDYSSGYYEFDIRMVWYHADTETFYTARDSGCSCPSPFEDYCSLDRLERLDVGAIEAEVRAETRTEAPDSHNPYSYGGISGAEGQNFLRKIYDAV
jgi:hypothetical protein